MKTQYYTASSIDGFIADADNSLEWLFKVPESDGDGPMKEEYPQFIADVGALAMGSTTYEWIANHTGFLTDPSKWDYTVPPSQTEATTAFAKSTDKESVSLDAGHVGMLVGPGAKDLRACLRDWLAPRSGDLIAA